MLIGDLLRRIPWIREFYTNAGILPNHTVLWRPPIARLVLVLLHVVAPRGVGDLVRDLLLLLLLLSDRLADAAVFHVLSFVMTTSLHNRMLFAENWGGVAIAALMVWTVFLPMGRRFSVDAVLASLRARRDETPEDLAAGAAARPTTRPARSLAVLGAAAADRDHLLVQLRPQIGRDLEGRHRGLLRAAPGADHHLAGPADPRARPVRGDQGC